MSPTSILLHAYYERLYDLLNDKREEILSGIETYLRKETKELWYDSIDDEAFDAYRKAANALLDERIEMYNPVGIQYTFSNSDTAIAVELELQLNWFDSSEEFNVLREDARRKAKPQMSEKILAALAQILILTHGAFPNYSIIQAYQQAPALNKLPDYVLALAIENCLKQQQEI